MKIFILSLSFIFVFLSNVQALTIYKYHDSKKPRCANIAVGYYTDINTHFEIGFGEDNQTPDSTVSVISPDEFVEWVKKTGGTEQEARKFLLKIESLSLKKVDGKVLMNEKDVILNASRKSIALFSDPKGILEPIEYQIKIISQIILILFAYNGTIEYSDIGIPSITNKTSADEFVSQFLLPLLIENNRIQLEAERFIEDNF